MSDCCWALMIEKPRKILLPFSQNQLNALLMYFKPIFLYNHVYYHMLFPTKLDYLVSSFLHAKFFANMQKRNLTQFAIAVG